jgi:RHS repeat-associated protein
MHKTQRLSKSHLEPFHQDHADAIVTGNAPLKTAFTFTNREWDDDIGIYYYRARYYDSGVGRFLQEDPDAGYLSFPKTLTTKYAYVANNPSGHIDPSGLSIWSFLEKQADFIFRVASDQLGILGIKVSPEELARIAVISGGVILLVYGVSTGNPYAISIGLNIAMRTYKDKDKPLSAGEIIVKATKVAIATTIGVAMGKSVPGGDILEQMLIGGVTTYAVGRNIGLDKIESEQAGWGTTIGIGIARPINNGGGTGGSSGGGKPTWTPNN